MQKLIHIVSFLVLLFSFTSFAQTLTPPYFKGGTSENRNTLYRSILQNTITKNLSLPLTDDTEENWMDAFWGMELLKYKSPWALGRINIAFDSIEKRSAGFQRSLLELAFTSFPGRFIRPVLSVLGKTTDAKVFAMSAEYILLNNKNALHALNLADKKKQLVRTEKDDAIIKQLNYSIQNRAHQNDYIPITAILSRDFLKTHRILYSFQRKNRNYPGLALIRDTAGNFIKDENGHIFSVPQLARSINNLPGYLTNGNTPQGIFRMYGFDTSKTTFIGPTANIQLTMPFETSLQHFFNDSTITDSLWTEEWYKKLLPRNLKDYGPLYESFYSGKAGRNEIIAHGTTVDPEYYSGEIYYPQTPTMGCLCTKEIWSAVDGKRLESDQQKLVDALQMAGGADGYCVVIELDDTQKPVSIHELLPLLNQLTSK